MKKVVRKRVREDRSGIFIPAGLFLGLGFGFLNGNVVSGVMFGLGAGFLAMALAWVFRK